MRRGLTLSVLASFTLALPCLPGLAQDPQTVFGSGPAAKKAAPAPAAAPAAKNPPAQAKAQSMSKSQGSTHAQAAPAHRASAVPRQAQTAPAHRSARPVAANGGGGGGGQVTASPGAISAYCNRLWAKVNNNWDFATGKNHVVLTVDVDSAGNVFSTSASSVPKNADAESKAQQALSKSQPLDALPTGLPSARVTITFDSTADPHGESSSSGRVSLRYDPNNVPSTTSSAPAEGAAPANSGNPPASGAPTATQ